MKGEIVLKFKPEHFEEYLRQMGYEKVVRCADCKYWTVTGTGDDDYYSCGCDALIRYRYFYCANGERIEE